jgi:hypothetical protein
MSNEMSIFADKSAVPAHLIDNSVSDLTKSLAGGASTKRISIKGSVFRMMSGSQEIAVNEDRSMKLVIVGAAPGFGRTFYEGKYKEGATVSPSCWSDDGKGPSPHCETPQSKMCETCPQNIKGSGEGTSRACRFSARVAVALESDIAGGIYGMTIPATSLFGEGNGTHSPLQEYVRKLAGYNISLEKVVTEFKFDTASPVPKLIFRAVRPLNEDEYEAVKALAKHPEMAVHTGPRKFERKDDETEGKPAVGATTDTADEGEAEPKVVKKKATEVKSDKQDVAAILDEWSDD